MLYIGIDPGQGGGIAWMHRQGVVVNIDARKMPDTEGEICSLLLSLKQLPGNCHAAIEAVGPARGRNPDGTTRTQGVSSAFTFGRNYGFLRGCLVALRIPFEEVLPQRWQRELGLVVRGSGLTYSDRKNRNKQKAANLFPAVKVTHATADALLLMQYVRKTAREEEATQ